MNKGSQLTRRKLFWPMFAGGMACLVLVIIFVLTLPDNENKLETTASTTGPTTGSTNSETHNLDQEALAAMVGYDLLPKVKSGTVKPEQLVTRAEFAGLVTTALTWEGQPVGHPTYIDVMPDHPYYRAIEKTKALFDENTAIVEPGKDAPMLNFNPEGTMTRSEAVRFLSIALNLEATGQTLATTIQLPADDPIIMDSNLPFLWKDAARLFYLVINSRLPEQSGTFAILDVN